MNTRKRGELKRKTIQKKYEVTTSINNIINKCKNKKYIKRYII